MQNRKLSFWQYLSVALIIIVLGIVHAKFIGHYSYFTEPRFAWEVFYIAVSEFFIYILKPTSSTARIFTNFAYVLIAPLLSALTISVFQLIVGTPLLPRFLTLSSLVFTFVDLLLFWQYSVRFQKNFLVDKILILGDVIRSESLLFKSFEKEKPFEISEVLPLNSTCEQIIGIYNKNKFNVLVMDRQSQTEQEHVSAAKKLHATGVRIRTLTMFFDEWLGKMPISELEQISLLFDITENVSPTYMRVRRLIDIIVSFVMGIVLLILIPFVFVLNLFGNRGSLFYSQVRVGKANKPFKIYKFRTMIPNTNGTSEENSSQWTSTTDSRVSSVGKLMRILHIDEIPQVINIFKGEMTLVGPRPEQLKYVEQLAEHIPYYEMRHIVTPGITGWAQVKYHYGASVEDAIQKIQYEFYYIRHQGLLLDIKIVARTLQIIWRGFGR